MAKSKLNVLLRFLFSIASDKATYVFDSRESTSTSPSFFTTDVAPAFMSLSPYWPSLSNTTSFVSAAKISHEWTTGMTALQSHLVVSPSWQPSSDTTSFVSAAKVANEWTGTRMTALQSHLVVSPSWGPPTHIASVTRISRNEMTSSSPLSSKNTSELVSSFFQRITQLDFKQLNSFNESIDMMQGFLVATKTSNIKKHFKGHNIFLVSRKLEGFLLKYAEYHMNESELSIVREDIVLNARKVGPTYGNYTFEFPDLTKGENKITLPTENVQQESLIVSTSLKPLDDLISTMQYKISENRYNLQSRIISISVKPHARMLIKNVTLKFSISQVKPYNDSKTLCVFWQFPTMGRKDAGWSSDGCTMIESTDEYVECSCNHLTHFAVLMQVKDDQVSRDQDTILTILTNFGLGLSIVGCILTFMAYWRFTDVKSEQSQIRMNLVLVLAVAHILFLLGSAARFHLILCISVAALLQFFYTSALCWMFAEGIQLYMQVIKVFNTNLKMRQVYGFAWGFPLILIIVSLSIAGNGSGGLASFVNEDFCWLSLENQLILTFIAPVLFLILCTHVILVMVVKEMTKINKQNVATEHSSMLRTSIRALVILAPLLGITWGVGLLCIMGVGIVGLYIFTILNSFQGCFIFIFHCLRNSEIQGKLRRRIQAFDKSRLNQPSSVAHCQSNQTNSIPTKAASNQVSPTKALQAPQKSITLSDFNDSDFEDGKGIEI